MSLHLHRWTKWSLLPFADPLSRRLERWCTRCGKVEEAWVKRKVH